MFHADLKPIISTEHTSEIFKDGNRALFERSEEPEFTGFAFDSYIGQRLSKYAKIAGSRLA